jgi:hypothetical protein
VKSCVTKFTINGPNVYLRILLKHKLAEFI